MKKILFIALITVMTLLAVYALLVRTRQGNLLFSAVWSSRSMTHAFPKFKSGEVTQIQIRWKKISSTLQRKDGKWFLKERAFLPASAGKIANLLSALSSVSPVKELRNCSEEVISDLHLTDGDPDGKKIPGIRVILKDANGKELFNILLGKGHFLLPEDGMNRSANAEGRYVLIRNRVFLIPLVFEECHPVPAAWVEALRLQDLQKTLYMASYHKAAGQTRAQARFQVFRRGTNHPFTLLYPKGKQADNTLLSGIAAELSKPFTGDYFSGNAAALAGREMQGLLLRTADGFQYRLHVIDHNDQTDVVSLSVQYDPSKVLPIPGEKKEALAKRKEVLAKRFEQEKFYTEGKLFLTGKKLKTLLGVLPVKEGRKKIPAANPVKRNSAGNSKHSATEKKASKLSVNKNP